MHKELIEAVFKATPATRDYAEKCVLVTGASAQIGLNVAAISLARGARVIATRNKTFVGFAHPRLTWLAADLSAPGPLAIPSGDILIHSAPIWLLPQRLPDVAAAGIKRIVAFSSASIFGKHDTQDPTERSVVESLTRAESEVSNFAAARGLQVTIFRPTMTYGMGLDINITRLARAIRRFHAIPICNPALGLRQPVQARDLAHAALAVWDNSMTYGKSYNLGGGDIMPYRVMLERLFRHLDKEPRLLPIPFLPQSLDFLNKLFPFLHINGEIARRMNRDLIADNEPAAADFGYKPRGFLAGDVIV
jgi:nucleoside-diphosphate-sugar epimerase